MPTYRILNVETQEQQEITAVNAQTAICKTGWKEPICLFRRVWEWKRLREGKVAEGGRPPYSDLQAFYFHGGKPLEKI